MKRFFLFTLCILMTSQACFAKPKLVIPAGSGYVGDLPDVTKNFPQRKEVQSSPLFESVDGFNNQNQIKPVPRNNPTFVNIILKKDKTSQYVNDINELIPIIEKLEDSIEDKEDIQKFSARAYYLKENVEYLRDKYQNRSEASYISFKKLMQLNMHIQTISQLRSEREVYAPYMAYSADGYIYNVNNINQQLEYLLKEIQETLVVLKETN